MASASSLTADSSWCSSTGGTWNAATSTCTNPVCGHANSLIAVGTNLTIPSGTTLDILNDCWITNDGGIVNNGALSLEVGALFVNNGTFYNYGTITQASTIQNLEKGSLVNEGTGAISIGTTASGVGDLRNHGRITNLGRMDICGVLTNQGSADNLRNITVDNCHVTGRDAGLLDNSVGALVEACGGFIVQATGSTFYGGNTTTVSCTVTSTTASLGTPMRNGLPVDLPLWVWAAVGIVAVGTVAVAVAWRYHYV